MRSLSVSRTVRSVHAAGVAAVLVPTAALALAPADATRASPEVFGALLVLLAAAVAASSLAVRATRRRLVAEERDTELARLRRLDDVLPGNHRRRRRA
jgi:hypothetical protein